MPSSGDLNMKLYKATGRRGEAKLRYFRSPMTHAVDVDGMIGQFFASDAEARDFASQKIIEGHDAIVVFATPYEPVERPETRSVQASFAQKLEQLFDTVHSPGGRPYTPEDLADALHEEGIPLAERLVERLLAGIGGRPPDATSAAIARFFGVEPGVLTEDSSDANPSSDERPSRTLGGAAPRPVDAFPEPDAVDLNLDTGRSSDLPTSTAASLGPGLTQVELPGRTLGVYAKARNNDPAVPFNSRKKRFKSGRGFAVDIRVRDHNGSAAQRYAEGVIIGFWESETEARRVAQDVNSGRAFGPGHHLHARAHSAIVIPAWNSSEFPGDRLPWETREGSAEMVAAYESAGVPIPHWLLKILARLDGDARRTIEKTAATSSRCDENASESEHVAPVTMFDSLGASDSRSKALDDEFLQMILNAVKVGEVISTLGTARPNRIVSIDKDGVRVITEKSERKGSGPQLVPAWMIVAAWDHLRRCGNLTQKQLVNELNVKRSAFICALLSRLPNVEYDAVPHVTLRLVQNTAAAAEVASGGCDAEGEAKHKSSQQVSPHVDAASQSEDAGCAGPEGYASRLNRLFDTVHPDGRGPWSSEEVAESLQMDGIPLHANSISRLREGVGDPPSESVTHALAYFFNVDPDYFFDGIDFSDGVTETPTTRHDLSPLPHVPSRAPNDVPSLVESEDSVWPAEEVPAENAGDSAPPALRGSKANGGKAAAAPAIKGSKVRWVVGQIYADGKAQAGVGANGNAYAVVAQRARQLRGNGKGCRQGLCRNPAAGRHVCTRIFGLR